MEFFVGLLQNVLGAVVGGGVSYIPGLVTRLFRTRTQGMKSEELQRLLHCLGATSPDNIRGLVHQVFSKEPRVTAQQREDVAAALISLARGATLLNSQGDPRSVYVRAQD